MNADERAARLDPRHVFGKVIADQMALMADDYQRIADQLRRIAEQVPTIGQPAGMTTVTATGLITEALREIARSTPSPAVLVLAAADYEKHVPTRTDS